MYIPCLSINFPEDMGVKPLLCWQRVYHLYKVLKSMVTMIEDKENEAEEQ
jgi:hypothetical protein